MRLSYVYVICLVVALCVVESPFYFDDSDAKTIDNSFSLKLTDAEGHDLSDPLFGGNVVVYFDTQDTITGKIYKLNAMLSIKTVPANILITAPGGLFKLSVSATGINSFLKDTGMRFSIETVNGTYYADLKNGNTFSDIFHNDAGTADFDPNLEYPVSLCLLDGYDSSVPPESVQGIKITFQAIASEGFHQVMFVSEDEIIASYVMFDNEVIVELPSVSRSGYSFGGWFTPDGREIKNGYVISPDEGDILAIAKWESNSGGLMLYMVGGGGVAAAAALLLLFALKKRKADE